MQFNTEKFECLRYGKNSELKSASHYLSQNGEKIEDTPTVRDLGVLMSDDGRFTAHIERIRQKASNICGWILRTFKTRAKEPMLILWKALVLPHLDYCCQLWSPDRKADIQTLEMIQKTFLRTITGYSHLNYWEKLKEFRMYSLERRRERYAIIYTWRMLEYQVPNIGIIAHKDGRRGNMCVVPPIKRNSPKWAQDLKEACLSTRGPFLFNCAPKEVRDLNDCTTLQFKTALDRWLRTILDEPQLQGHTAQRRAPSNSIRHMMHVLRATTIPDRSLEAVYTGNHLGDY